MNIGVALSGRRLKQISALSVRKYREEYGQSVVEGFRSVASAVDGGADVVDIVATREALEGNLEAAQFLGAQQAPVYLASPQNFGRLSNVTSSQGIIAVVRTHWSSITELGALERVVAFDGVQDPGNVGTMIRTAAWLGLDGVLAGPGTADLFGPKVLRASMGGIWDVVVARCDDLPAALQSLIERGHRLTAADFGGADVEKWTPTIPATLVVGNEGSGLSLPARSMVHDVVTIPSGQQVRGVESLNVSVAAAIIMHHWCGGGSTGS